MTTSRRTFLNGITVAGVGVTGSGEGNPASPVGKTLPTIRIGSKTISRLIAGSNPLEGGSHLTKRMSKMMYDYFTLERTIEFLQRCEQEGITTFQSPFGRKVCSALRTMREKGGKMQHICLAYDRPQDPIPEILALNPIAIVHHGFYTDEYFHTGKQEKIHDYIKKVHDAGVMAGVSTHDPTHVARMEDSGWENDFYMTCLHNIYRPAETIKAALGSDVVGELYLASDPQKMTDRIRQVKKPCLAFKILAAGRMCTNQESIENAFKFAYGNIKRADAVIVGMFPIFNDEVQEDCDLARKYGRIA